MNELFNYSHGDKPIQKKEVFGYALMPQLNRMIAKILRELKQMNCMNEMYSKENSCLLYVRIELN